MAEPSMAEILADPSDVGDWALEEWERTLAGMPPEALEASVRERNAAPVRG